MGRLRLRAKWQQTLSHKDRTDPNTIVDEKYKEVVEIEAEPEQPTIKTCADLPEETCINNCTWYEGRCYDSNEVPVECDQIHEEQTCVGRSDCQWAGSICFVKTKPCEAWESQLFCNSVMDVIKPGTTQIYNKCTWT